MSADRIIETANPLPADIDWRRVQDVLGVTIASKVASQFGLPVFSSPEVDDLGADVPVVNPNRDAILDEKVDESILRRNAHRAVAGPFSLGEPTHDRLAVGGRVNLEDIDAVVQRRHNDSSTRGGRPESVALHITVEVSGRGCGDSCTCACGGAK